MALDKEASGLSRLQYVPLPNPNSTYPYNQERVVVCLPRYLCRIKLQPPMFFSSIMLQLCATCVTIILIICFSLPAMPPLPQQPFKPEPLYQSLVDPYRQPTQQVSGDRRRHSLRPSSIGGAIRRENVCAILYFSVTMLLCSSKYCLMRNKTYSCGDALTI